MIRLAGCVALWLAVACSFAAPALSTDASPEQLAHQAMAEQPPNWELARAQFLIAAEAGSVTAMSYLGWIYESGHGVSVDAAQARSWYAAAAEAGAPEFARKVAWMYLAGDGLTPDRKKAEAWFSRAIEAGDAESRIALASVYVGDGLAAGPDGDSAESNMDAAVDLLEQALHDGDVRASYFLVRIYFEGIGGHPVQHANALEYAKLGADAGMASLQGYLGYFYLEGVGGPTNLIQAAKWSQLASLANDPMGVDVWQQVQTQLAAEQQQEAQRLVRHWVTADE